MLGEKVAISTLNLTEDVNSVETEAFDAGKQPSYTSRIPSGIRFDGGDNVNGEEGFKSGHGSQGVGEGAGVIERRLELRACGSR